MKPFVPSARRAISFVRKSPLALEALGALALARCAISLPIRWSVDREAIAAAPSSMDPAALRRRTQDPRAQAVGAMVLRVSRLTPWKSTCLVHALAARRMLRRRAIPSTLRLGVRNDAAGLAAHAWLEACGGIVCGGADAEGFTHLVSFGHADIDER